MSSRAATEAIVLGFGSIGRRFCRVLHDDGMPLTIVNRRESVRLEAAAEFPSARVVDQLEALDGDGVDWAGTLAVIATWAPHTRRSSIPRRPEASVDPLRSRWPIRCSRAAMVARAERGLCSPRIMTLRYAGLPPLCFASWTARPVEPAPLIAQGGAAVCSRT